MINKLLITVEEKSRGGFFIEEDAIYYHTSERSIDKIKEKVGKSAMMGGTIFIPFAKLDYLEFKDGENDLDINYFNDKDKSRYVNVPFENEQTTIQVAAYLKTELNLTAKTKEVSNYSKLLPYFGWIVIAILAIAFLFSTALEYSKSGAKIDPSSGKSELIMTLIYAISDRITPYGILAIGLAIIGFIAFKAKKSLAIKSDQQKHIYSK